MKILIADDSHILRTSLSKLIWQNHSITDILSAGTINEAIQIINKNRPELLIIDINFPEGSGIEILQFAKSKTPDSIAIILTNFASEQLERRCRREGAEYFFDKSTEFEKVVDVINSLSDTKSNRN